TTLPAFADAYGMVLSDFPADFPAKSDDKKSSTGQLSGDKILLRLLFIKKAVEKYLGIEHISQKFMPLCEDERSIKNIQEVIQNILAQLKEREKDPQLQSLFTTNHG